MAVGQAQQPVPAGQHPTAFIGKLREIYLVYNHLVYVFRLTNMSLNLNESKIQLIHFIYFVSFYTTCYASPLKGIKCVKLKTYFLLMIEICFI